MVNNNTVISLNTSSYDRVAFDRKELSTILSIYGRMVSTGDWRDYGISMLRHIAMDGRILKRGSNLKTVLHVLEKKLIRAVN